MLCTALLQRSIGNIGVAAAIVAGLVIDKNFYFIAFIALGEFMKLQ